MSQALEPITRTMVINAHGKHEIRIFRRPEEKGGGYTYGTYDDETVPNTSPQEGIKEIPRKTEAMMIKMLTGKNIDEF